MGVDGRRAFRRHSEGEGSSKDIYHTHRLKGSDGIRLKLRFTGKGGMGKTTMGIGRSFLDREAVATIGHPGGQLMERLES